MKKTKPEKIFHIVDRISLEGAVKAISKINVSSMNVSWEGQEMHLLVVRVNSANDSDAPSMCVCAAAS